MRRRRRVKVTLTQSLKHWLFVNHREIIVPLLLGHFEVLDEEMCNEYLEWCETDEGKQYLKGGSQYKEEEQ